MKLKEFRPGGATPLSYKEISLLSLVHPSKLIHFTTFAAPSDGLYLFTVHVLGNDQTNTGFSLRVDGTDVAFTRNDFTKISDHATEITVLLTLTAGQAVDVKNYAQTSIHGTSDGSNRMYSWFTGYLVKGN